MISRVDNAVVDTQPGLSVLGLQRLLQLVRSVAAGHQANVDRQDALEACPPGLDGLSGRARRGTRTRGSLACVAHRPATGTHDVFHKHVLVDVLDPLRLIHLPQPGEECLLAEVTRNNMR